MATYDNSVLASTGGSADGSTGAFTIAAGAIALALIADGGQGSLNSVTIAGQTGTLVGTHTQGSRTVRIYKTLVPTSGSQVISYDGNGSYGDNSMIVVVGLSVIEASDFADYTEAGGTTGGPTVDVPNEETGDLIIDVVYHGNLGAVGANQTQRQEHNNGQAQVRVSTQAGADGGVMSHSSLENLNWAIAAVRAVNAAEAGGSILRQMMQHHC